MTHSIASIGAVPSIQQTMGHHPQPTHLQHRHNDEEEPINAQEEEQNLWSGMAEELIGEPLPPRPKLQLEELELLEDQRQGAEGIVGPEALL